MIYMIEIEGIGSRCYETEKYNDEVENIVQEAIFNVKLNYPNDYAVMTDEIFKRLDAIFTPHESELLSFSL